MSIKSIISIAVLATSLLAQTSLWKIEKDNNHLFLGGTIHVLRPTDYPLPKPFNDAFAKSGNLVFEVDMGKMNSPEMQSKLTNAMLYKDGTTLKDHISAETYQLLSKTLSAKGIPVATVNQMKPFMVSMMLTQLEMTKYQMAAEGVDNHFFKKAEANNKKVIGLESIEQQITFLSELGKDDPDGLIKSTIEETGKLESMIITMVDAWKTGNANQLDSLIIKDMKELYPAIYQSMLVDRNNNWMPSLTEMLTSEPIELVLVGAGHLVGDEGLLAMFESKGYKVTQLK